MFPGLGSIKKSSSSVQLISITHVPTDKTRFLHEEYISGIVTTAHEEI
jgi:hypothetical protein